MKKRGKFFVVEARRLIPLLFLLALLIGLTVYDNFFRLEPTAGPSKVDADSLIFTTTDWGALTTSTSFNLVADDEGWAKVSQEMGLILPDYPFNAAAEVAVFAVNSEIQSMNVIPGLGEAEIRVLVEPKDNFYHVITVDRNAVDLDNAVWQFVDQEDQILSRIIPFWQLEEEDEQEEDTEQEEQETIK